MNCGVIYRIISPSGRVYIGQTVNYDKRMRRYKSLKCEGQRRLHNSFIKYGFDAHEFTVLETCIQDQLNIRERHYQEQYDVISDRGLNCALTSTKEKRYTHSKETLHRMRIGNLGKTLSPEHIEKLRYKRSEETKQRLKAAKVDISAETRQRLSTALKGRTVHNKGIPMSTEQKELLSRVKMGVKLPGLEVIDAQGNIYRTVREAAQANGMSRQKLEKHLNGINKGNTTGMQYLKARIKKYIK